MEKGPEKGDRGENGWLQWSVILLTLTSLSLPMYFKNTKSSLALVVFRTGLSKIQRALLTTRLIPCHYLSEVYQSLDINT